MTDTTLIKGGLLEKEGAGSSHWVRRTVLVTFCLLLLGTLCVAFTRVIAARIPEQRATLEKLITDRTGLAVRFDNVHFAWTLDGTSAVFTHVELTDPKAGRVRVVAPELRVEFDAWDFMRHQQFSLGHVTLSSPDIEIIGDPVESSRTATIRRGNAPPATANMRTDEAALVRRFTDWAELMPVGRVEVEGARVHLKRRGDRAAHQTFTLSQAVVSRGTNTLNAFGTMLLSQDVGQSLFVSANLESLGARSKVSGELRVIARRVFLDKLPVPGLEGRGTLDAKLVLRDGRVESGSWQASARELALNGEHGAHFDHVTVNGKLARDANDILIDFSDLQLTRGARLERAPNLSARLALEPGSLHIVRTKVQADRVPFMAAEFIAGLLAPQINDKRFDDMRFNVPGEWSPVSGELRALRFDSGNRLDAPDGWSFDAQVAGVDLARAHDHATLTQLAARVRLDAHELQLTFDPANSSALRMSRIAEPRPFVLNGVLALTRSADSPNARFENFTVSSGSSSLNADGRWREFTRAAPLALTFANLDRELLNDAWILVARDDTPPALLAEFDSGSVVEGSMQLVAASASSGVPGVDWQHSSGTLKLAGLGTASKDLPRLIEGRGAFNFARGGSQLRLEAGTIDQLSLTDARVDWPRTGAPHLRASLQGQLSAPLLRETLAAQGLDRLEGAVAIEADARGMRELRDPGLWRVIARITDGSIALSNELPRVEKLVGIVRYDDRQLRSLSLDGIWLGGPVEIDARRGAALGPLSVAFNGTADAAPLLKLLGQPEVANRVSGQLAWNGTAQRLTDNEAWQISLASNLAGVESRLPEPFNKARARLLPVTAQLRVEGRGIREFEIAGGRDLAVRGRVDNGVTTARFEVQGIAGDLRRSAAANAEPQVDIDKLDLHRAPALLAAAGAVLPADVNLAIAIGDLRQADRSLGAMRATLARRDGGVEFSFESPEQSLHRLNAHGGCTTVDARCRLEFTADTAHLATLLRGAALPQEWPAETLHAVGELSWPLAADADIGRTLTGQFDIETQGSDSNHTLSANATLADGQIQLANVQGTGPAPTQVFRGAGRVGILARDYDLTVDYEQVSLAATAVPTPARARLARAWSSLRGSVARRGWTPAPESHRVQWQGSWDR
jgi:Protein of unknown function